jgi:threonylcarbamoyladenosine tRNA methylthiotransferase MtaB
MKYSVITFGCRVNQADSLGFETDLRARGAVADDLERADVVVVNTCSVTASADQSARQAVRRVARTNPEARIVVTGCYATRCPEEFHDAAHVLRVVRNEDKSQLVRQLFDDLGISSAQRYGDGDGSCGAAIEPGVAGRTAFTLRVQTGCAEACTYCIIPTTRGAPTSVPTAEILAQLDRVASAGFKEVALTGVHLGSYGRDLVPPSSLIELLRAVASREDTHVRYRISSLEPMDCTPQLVSLVATNRAFAPHFHLPLQHSSDRLLAAMRRPYSIEYYAELVNRIRRQLPDASIGSDVIVGFPGETETEFDHLCEYLASSPLTHVHVFPYSDRPGTVASLAGAKVAGGTIRARASRVREIGQRLAAGFREAQRGTVHRALTIDDGSVAVTGNNLKVNIPPGRSRNEWVELRITGIGGTLSGEVL